MSSIPSISSALTKCNKFKIIYNPKSFAIFFPFQVQEKVFFYGLCIVVKCSCKPQVTLFVCNTDAGSQFTPKNESDKWHRLK